MQVDAACKALCAAASDLQLFREPDPAYLCAHHCPLAAPVESCIYSCITCLQHAADSHSALLQPIAIPASQLFPFIAVTIWGVMPRHHATWHAVPGLHTSSCLLGIACLAACADSCEAAATARLHCSNIYRSAPSGTCLLCREMEGAITLPAQKTSKAAATRQPRPAMDEPGRLGPHLSAANAELRHAPTACIAGGCFTP